MFTGIVEEVGRVRFLRGGSKDGVLRIAAKRVLGDVRLGDSIAVNGVCLTVTSMGGSYYTADVMAETMNRSSLGQLSTGAKVNLERAMPANGRFGGHIVSGHIDGTGTVQSIEPDDNAVWYTIAAKADLLRYIVEKGSITIDGISLTVAYVDAHCFKVSIIPHTQQVTALHDRKVGDIVNLECDIIGKYVEKLMRPAPAAEEQETKKESGITEDFLKKYGF